MGLTGKTARAFWTVIGVAILYSMLGGANVNGEDTFVAAAWPDALNAVRTYAGRSLRVQLMNSVTIFETIVASKLSFNLTIEGKSRDTSLEGFDNGVPPTLILKCSKDLTGPAVKIRGSASSGNSLVLRNLVFQSCSQGAVFIQGLASVRLEHVTYRDNSNPGSLGGALILQDVISIELSDCSFYRNSAAHAGAMLFASSRTAVLSECKFIGNSAEGDAPADLLPPSVGAATGAPPRAGGGALFITVTDVEIRKTDFIGNMIDDPSNGVGAGAAFVGSAVTITRSSFLDGKAHRGGGFMLIDSNLTMEDSRLIGNGLKAGLFGGGLSAWQSNPYKAVSYTIKSTEIRNNSIGSDYSMGGGCFFQALGPGHYVMENITCMENESQTGGGCFAIDGKAEPGEVTLDVIGGIYRGNFDAWIAGAIGTWVPMNATFNGAIFEDNQGSSYAGAILNQGVGWAMSQLTMRNCVLRNNTADLGGAVYIENGALEVENGTFLHNKATTDGGAVYSTPAKACSFTATTFEGNEAANAGGILFADRTATVQFKDSVITKCKATQGGGVFITQGGDALFHNTTFADNRALEFGGSIVATSIRRVVAVELSCRNNSAIVGGAIAVDQSDLTCTRCNLSYNNAMAQTGSDSRYQVVSLRGRLLPTGLGGGVLALGTPRVQLTDSVLIGNIAQHSGGAVHVEQSILHMDNCLLADNQVLDGRAGGVYMALPPVAPADLPLQQEQQGSPKAATALWQHSTLRNNSAKTAGAAYLAGTGDGSAGFKCWNCTLSSNAAKTEDGGALVMMGLSKAVVTASVLEANTAAQHGGAVSCRNCEHVLLEGSTFRNNTARGLGGGLLCRSCRTATITGNCTFENGEASSGAGIAILRSGSGKQQAKRGGSDASAGPSLRIESAHFRNLRTLRRQEGLSPGTAGSTENDSGKRRLLLDLGSSLSSREQQPKGQIYSGAWQTGFLAVGSSSDPFSCSTFGAGGALCAELDGPMHIEEVHLFNNSARFGGGLFISGSCEDQCCLSVGGGVKFEDNVVTGQGAGGAVFAVNSAALSQHGRKLAECPSPSAATDADVYGSDDLMATNLNGGRQNNKLPQVLLDAVQMGDNSAYDGSYGPAVATMAAGFGDVQLITENLRQQAPRTQGSDEAVRMAKSAYWYRWQEGVPLAVGKGAFFGLKVSLLDSFGAVVSAQLSEDIPVAVLRLAQGLPRSFCSSRETDSTSSSTADPSCLGKPGQAVGDIPGSQVVDLSGVTVMPLRSGVATFTGLRLLAPPGAGVPMQVTLSGSSFSVPPLDFTIKVKPCGAGQLGNGTGECIQCPIPQFTLSAEDKLCRPCPGRMQCLGAAPIPQEGTYQPHPYSTVALSCRNPTACAYPGREFTLADFQQQLQGIPAPSKLSLQAYKKLQCAEGYEGAGCGRCDRKAGYGLSVNHRCHKCPPLIVSWAAFLLARCLDILLVMGIVMVWWYGAPLASEAVASLGKKGQQEEGDLSMSALAPADSTDSTSCLVTKPAAREHRQIPLAQKLILCNAVLLLPAVVDWVQLASVYASLDAIYSTPGWLGSWLHVLLLSPQSTTTWVSWDCLLPTKLVVSSAVYASIFNIFLPVLLTGACISLVYGIASLCSSTGVYAAAQRQSKTLSHRLYQLLRLKQERQQYHPVVLWSPRVWPKGIPAVYLCAMAASTYTFMLTCSTVTAIYQCARWPAPSIAIPGEYNLGGTLYWSQDRDVVCFRGEHILLVVAATLVGIPGMAVYLLLLVAACRSCVNAGLTEQGESGGQSPGGTYTLLLATGSGSIAGAYTPFASSLGPAAGYVQERPVGPPVEEIHGEETSPSDSRNKSCGEGQGAMGPASSLQSMLLSPVPPTMQLQTATAIAPGLAAALKRGLDKLPWALLLSGQPWGTCWWLPFRELAKVLVGIGIGVLGGRSAFTQVVFTMGAIGTGVLMQTLVQPWQFVWVRQGAELAYGALLMVGVLMTGLMVATAAGGRLVAVEVGLSGSVVAVVGLVTLFWVWKLASVRRLYYAMKLQQ